MEYLFRPFFSSLSLSLSLTHTHTHTHTTDAPIEIFTRRINSCGYLGNENLILKPKKKKREKKEKWNLKIKLTFGMKLLIQFLGVQHVNVIVRKRLR